MKAFGEVSDPDRSAVLTEAADHFQIVLHGVGDLNVFQQGMYKNYLPGPFVTSLSVSAYQFSIFRRRMIYDRPGEELLNHCGQGN